MQTVAVMDIDPLLVSLLTGIWVTLGLMLVAIFLLMLRVGKLERRMHMEANNGNDLPRVAHRRWLPRHRA